MSGSFDKVFKVFCGKCKKFSPQTHKVKNLFNVTGAVWNQFNSYVITRQ